MTSTKPATERSALMRSHHHGSTSKHNWQHRIALQLSELFNYTVSSDQICVSIGSPKHAKHGQFTLPLHRIQHLFTHEPWCSQTASENAQWIVTKISPSDCIEKTSAIGSFVNFVIPKSKYMESILQQIVQESQWYGFDTSSIGTDNNASSDANSPLVLITCELPMIPLLLDPNHFRGLVLATFLQRSCRIQGRDVQLVNTLNIWNAEFGYFALAVSKYGLPPSSQIDSLTRMNQIYLQIKQDALTDIDLEKKAQTYLLQLEQGEDEVTEVWQQLQAWMVDHYQLLFEKRLSIYFDCHICSNPGEDLEIVYNLLEKCDELIKAKDGEWTIDLESAGLGVPRLRDSMGVSTQLTREIAQIIKQERTLGGRNCIEYHFAGHHLTRHIQQAHHIISIMKCYADQQSEHRIHVDFGKVRYDTTTATNPSNFCLLECLDSLRQTMLDIMEENEGTEKYDAMMAQLGQLSITTRTKRMNDMYDGEINNNNNLITPVHKLAEQHADRLGLCTMMIHQLTQRRKKPMQLSSSSPPDVFGNSGVFLQYVHSRLCGIEQQLVKRELVSYSGGGTNQIDPPTTDTHGMGKLLYQQEAFDLIEWMTQFPRIIQQALVTTDPSTLVSYLFKLARMANQSLYGLRIKDVQEDLALARWTLFWAARQTLANGLVALGIEPVYRM
ncbi:hypothetical protein BCR42DRAFT_495512 [Absidia repens]|uniref:arginine--tRNA ligase n=1 Tax=Absidia repens TaxID=90262 RepID=A0A1X2I3L0_9FUNG|nr:hypothetical protein BCR42DRAFT_495512 [Absidia repens]